MHDAMVQAVDADGRLSLSFATLDDRLRAAGYRPGLAGAAAIEFGAGGWAGILDLGPLRAAWADRHARAVLSGRGSPRLFAALHPDHPMATAARALALEADLARQERDYRAVVDGRLAPWAFLRLHPWSPYRRAVAALAGSHW